MAQSKRDELADALAAMAGGNVAPTSKPDAGRPIQSRPVPAPSPNVVAKTEKIAPAKPKVIRPELPQSNADVDAEIKPVRPNVPLHASPKMPQATVAPRPQQKAPEATNDAARRRAASTTARPAPTPPPPAVLPSEQFLVEDDTVDAPAPETPVYVPTRHKAAAGKKASSGHFVKSLSARQTMIPILLTVGTILTGLGITMWLINADYPFSAQNLNGLAIAVPIIGVIILLIALVNMAFVKRQLAGK